MKPQFLLLISVMTALALLSSACRKDDEYMSDAVITGYDVRECACCCGLMINFDGQTQPYTGDFKLIDNSAKLGIDSYEIFPVYVKVDWTSNADKCFGSYIEVTKLKRNRCRFSAFDYTA